jgi:hypothetical protein
MALNMIPTYLHHHHQNHNHNHRRRELALVVLFLLAVSLHRASSFVLAPVVPFAIAVGTGRQRGSSTGATGGLSPTTVTSSSSTTTTTTTGISWRTSRPSTTGASMRPTRRYVFNLYSSTRSNAETENTNIELPANLKRKVDAKRPPLGHVIPKATKSKKKGGEGSSSF